MNINVAKWLSVSLVRSGRNILPADENALSTGPEEAGITR